MIIVTVKPGDSIYKFARQYNISPEQIISANELTNAGRLVVGQDLIIPVTSRTHTVKRGESLYTIARQYGVSVRDIQSANPGIQNPYTLQIGQKINIPTSPSNKPTIEVNGYSYPNTSAEVIRKTLPSLTYLSIFGYKASPDGSLDTIPDEAQIAAARAAKVAPIMVVTNIRPNGGFDTEIMHTILASPEIRARLITNIINTVNNKGYYGVNIDFEYIRPTDRELYNTFLTEMNAALKPYGYILMTSLAPKNRADQPGTLYEAHDYPAHGRIVDRVILMTYEWGYTYGPPMAVSPVTEVMKVLDYAVTAIPPSKILMGMSNYAYDWTLPYKQGTAAEGLTVEGAVQRALTVGARIEYDQKSQAPFYTYYDRNRKQHVVWFESARSIEARLNLVNDYNLAGVSYWTINRYFPQNWLILNSMFNVKKVL